MPEIETPVLKRSIFLVYLGKREVWNKTETKVMEVWQEATVSEGVWTFGEVDHYLKVKGLRPYTGSIYSADVRVPDDGGADWKSYYPASFRTHKILNRTEYPVVAEWHVADHAAITQAALSTAAKNNADIGNIKLKDVAAYLEGKRGPARKHARLAILDYLLAD